MDRHPDDDDALDRERGNRLEDEQHYWDRRDRIEDFLPQRAIDEINADHTRTLIERANMR